MHPFIRRIWHEIIFKALTKDIVFGKKGPNDDIYVTFIAISNIVTYNYKLPLPDWWL